MECLHHLSICFYLKDVLCFENSISLPKYIVPNAPSFFCFRNNLINVLLELQLKLLVGQDPKCDVLLKSLAQNDIIRMKFC